MLEYRYEVGVKFKEKTKSNDKKEEYFDIKGKYSAVCIDLFTYNKNHRDISVILLSSIDPIKKLKDLKRDLKIKLGKKFNEFEVVFLKQHSF